MLLADTSWALILGVSFVAAIIGGMGGFGTGVMLTAVLTPIIGIKATVPVLAVAGIIINGGRFWFYRDSVDQATVKRVLPSALILLTLGAFLFERLHPAWLTLLVGVLVIAAIPIRRVLKHRGVRVGPRGVVVGGGVFGLLNGVASGMGVVLVSLLLGAGLTGTAVLATDAYISIIVDVAKAALFGGLDVLQMQGVVLGTVVGVASLPGSWIAAFLVKRLNASLHILVIDALIVFGGASMIWQGVRAL